MFPTYKLAVTFLRDKSIDDAVYSERKTNTHTNSDIHIMTDDRHACRKNSFHTDVTALGNITHKVV